MEQNHIRMYYVKKQSTFNKGKIRGGVVVVVKPFKGKEVV